MSVSLTTRWTARVEAEGDAVVRALRAEVEAAGGPLTQPLDDGSGAVEVCFVWFDDASDVASGSSSVTVSVFCQLAGCVPAPMVQLGRAPVWMLSVSAPPAATVPYQFVVDDPLHGVGLEDLMALLAQNQQHYLAAVSEQQQRKVADPLNSRRIAPQAALIVGEDPAAVERVRWESVLDLAPGRPNTATAPAAPSRWEGVLESAALGNERRVALRRSPGPNPEADAWLLVALDGDLFDGPWRLLDAVHEHADAGRLPPLTSVAVYNASVAARAAEMVGRDEVATMLADELPAWLREQDVGLPPRERIVLAGISATGLAAAHAADTRPEVYGAVLSCSGGFIAGDPDDAGQWYGLGSSAEPEWLTRRIATEPRQPVRFWLDVGTLERDPMPQTPGLSILTANRHLRTVLSARGYDVALDEFPGGHDLVHWQHTVVDGLRHLTSSH